MHSPLNSGAPKTRLGPTLAIVGILALSLLLGTSPHVAGQSADFELPPINYQDTPSQDRVAQLAQSLASGALELAWDDEHGYLPATLKALDVPVSSQSLVFSKTSLQLHRISPRKPRAVYFNDDVYVGWCQDGDVLELAATDPNLGAVFYTIAQQNEPTPEIIRDRGQCMTCHASSRTQGVPGYLVRSVFSDASGYPKFGSGTYLTDHTSDFQQRWGGWYVTGNHGNMRHMGNQVSEGTDREPKLDREAGANRESLDDVFRTERYLSPHSDLVALMVLEYQTQMHNAITAASFETRRAIHQSKQMNELLDRPADYLSDSAVRRIDSAAANVVKYILMCDEFVLQDQVSGTSEFAQAFEQRGLRDSKGRSLRDFDLKTRLFRYPCSHLIYSPEFDAMPDEVRQRVVDQMIRILQGEEETEEFAHLSAETRQQILEILRETKPAFASQSS